MIGIDELDTKIVTCLQKDGRLPNTEIARRLGIAEATVRKRVERLLREKIIQIGAWADPLKVGYQIYAFIEIKVTRPYIEKVARELAKLPEIYFMGICTGEFDILAAALFRSNNHMYEFLTRHLGRMRGIGSTTTSSIIRIVKRDFAYPVPGRGTE